MRRRYADRPGRSVGQDSEKCCAEAASYRPAAQSLSERDQIDWRVQVLQRVQLLYREAGPLERFDGISSRVVGLQSYIAECLGAVLVESEEVIAAIVSRTNHRSNATGTIKSLECLTQVGRAQLGSIATDEDNLRIAVAERRCRGMFHPLRKAARYLLPYLKVGLRNSPGGQCSNGIDISGREDLDIGAYRSRRREGLVEQSMMERLDPLHASFAAQRLRLALLSWGPAKKQDQATTRQGVINLRRRSNAAQLSMISKILVIAGDPRSPWATGTFRSAASA